MIEDLNIYDLFRTQYGNGASAKKMTEAERERTVIVEGQEKKYKLGYTPAERNPFHKKLQEGSAQVILGDSMSTYLNRADVRAAFNIPAFVPGYQPCNNPMYSTYQAFREGSIWIYNIL